HARGSVEGPALSPALARRPACFNGATLAGAWKGRRWDHWRNGPPGFNGATLAGAWKEISAVKQATGIVASTEPRSRERGRCRWDYAKEDNGDLLQRSHA